MACRGFIWYQGCHNAGEYQRYCAKMHALYNGWAKEFQNPDLKLYFVQLAPWGNAGIANIQMAQAKFAAEEKNAAMAVINDVGNLTDIHPNDKRTVAKRLAVHALKRDYGWDFLRDNSPTLKSWKIEGDKFILSFNDAQGWYVYNHTMGDQSVGFELAGADGVFKPARLVNVKKVEHRKRNSAFDAGGGAGDDARVVPSFDCEAYILFFRQGNALLGFVNRRRRLYRRADNKGHSRCRTAQNTARVVCQRAYISVFISGKRVVILAA